MKLKYCLMAIGILCLHLTGHTQTRNPRYKKTDSLYVGAKAPALQLTSWVKGKPITQFEKGKTYLINFTIINCPHCGPAISALSQIAKKYGDKVTIFSVYFDSAKYVREYINHLGDRFAYSAALDNSGTRHFIDGFMFQNWMINAGHTGFPTAMMVNRNGEIAWVGHPCSWFVDSLVSQVVATGSYDKGRLKEWLETGTKGMRNVLAALEENDSYKYSQAIHYLDSSLLRYPNNGDRILLKLKLLIKYDEPKAWQYAKSVMDSYCKEKNCDAYNVLATLAAIFIEHAGTLKQPDWEFVASLAEYQSRMSDKMHSSSFLHIQAEAMYLKGDYQAAIKLEESAIEHLQYRVGSPSGSGNRYYKDKLLLYKEKAGL